MKATEKATETRRWLRQAARLFLGGLLSLVLVSCANQAQSVRLLDLPDVPSGDQVRSLSGPISEVAPPAIFLDLADLIDGEPQVAIAAPKPDQVITATNLSAKFTLRGLSIYKDAEIGLGPHLQVILDNQPAQSVYSLDDSLEFSELSPGSHTLRVFAVQPWGESFKNEAAFAQTTFHVFAKTGANAPNPTQPLLTYSEPQGTYGAEPILLDFYLTNAPLHMIAQESAADDIADWRVRCTVNGQSFLFEQWQPVYLKGFKPGQNWVQVTLVDEQGDPIDNAFNSTVRLVNYDLEQQDALAKIVRGELPLEQIGQIAVSDYEPPAEPIVPVESEPVEPEPAELEPVELEPAEPEAVDIIESELQLEKQPTAAEPEAPDQLAPKTDQTEDTLTGSPAPEVELEYPAGPSGPGAEPLNQPSDEFESLEVPVEAEPSQLPEDLSDFESAADESIEASKQLKEEIEEPLTNLEKPAVDLTESELAAPADIPDTLTNPSADDPFVP